MRLLPVVELEPGTYATQSRDSPRCSSAEAPEEWSRYWTACLADSGLTRLQPVSPASWFVSTSDLSPSEVAIILGTELNESGIPGFPDSDGEVDADLDESISALPGGLVICEGAEPLVEPGCCGDLSNLDDWRDAVRDGTSDWQDLWIGHPHLRFRVAGDDAEIQETQEYNLPKNPRRFVVSAQALDTAILEAAQELERFEGVVSASLGAMETLHECTPDQLDLLARCLVGRRMGGARPRAGDKR